ncbi:hypothetical protein M440DRAFT_1159197 [Trichoderma longibrachiatum ATCC 18648]|uniref:Uncharacterized protein n=1 Tax=Trichoderma longibrachiatum ATCC 18648 TaxID=983965 RepID=A0A2T4CBW4_TRILO|nr:hypothetical protein M440DRAFT_1159197 [Trichoderma longibrachiatum ATCC 18648]
MATRSSRRGVSTELSLLTLSMLFSTHHRLDQASVREDGRGGGSTVSVFLTHPLDHHPCAATELPHRLHTPPLLPLPLPCPSLYRQDPVCKHLTPYSNAAISSAHDPWFLCRSTVTWTKASNHTIFLFCVDAEEQQ